MSNDTVDLQEFVAGFLIEADEYLDSINRNLVSVAEAVKAGRAEPRAVRELFRSLHTIKGLSSMVGAEPIVEISHEMEGLLRSADKSGGSMTDLVLDLLVKGTRAIEERVKIVSKTGIKSIPPAPTPLVEALATAQLSAAAPLKSTPSKISAPAELLKTLSASEQEQMNQAAQNGRRVLFIDFQPSPDRAARGINITSVRDAMSKLGELIKVTPRASAAAPTGILFSLLLITDSTNEVLLGIVDGTTSSIFEAVAPQATIVASLPKPNFDIEPEPNEWAPTDQSSIRVDIRRLDEAMERLSDLVITRSKLARAAAKLTAIGVDTREINAVISENARQLKRLRGAITKSRMVPLAELLQRLPLVVRGLTQNTEKSVNLIMRVGLAEVDKSVADKIFPAIVHLVRNSVDHAIESRELRSRLGKPEVGTLSVICDESSGTNLTLVLRDDGRGISRQDVARKASRPVAQSDEELLQQITLPGLSTRDDVTTTSGRGMGMDIVKRTVEMLGGRLSLKTTEGQGTEFKLQIPVSITIVDVLTFSSGGQVYAVPIAMVDEIMEIDRTKVVRAPSTAAEQIQPSLIQRRGEAIPYVTLDSIMSGTANVATAVALVVNKASREMVAYGVDRMLGQQEAVVRPLDDSLVRSDGIGGATDLGDGRPTLVLDLANFGDRSMKTDLRPV